MNSAESRNTNQLQDLQSMALHAEALRSIKKNPELVKQTEAPSTNG